MRVIAGKHRGRPLQAPPGRTTRPMPDRVRESLFNTLGHRFGTPGTLPELDVLDLFAGSGSLGIEALSRGARSCLFVERDRRSLRILRENLRQLELESDARISAENAWTMRFPSSPEPAQAQKRGQDPFRLVFLDPPYRDVLDPTGVLDLLERLAPALAPDALVILRVPLNATMTEHAFTALTCCDERTFGSMRVVFLRPPAAGNGDVRMPNSE